MTERQVDDANVVARAIADRPLHAGDDVARQPGPVRTEHAHVHNLRAWRDAAGVETRRSCICAADDARDVCAMAEDVERLRAATDEADIRHNVLERSVRGDARIEDGHANPLACDGGIGADQAEQTPRAGTHLRRAGRDVRYGHEQAYTQIGRYGRDYLTAAESVRRGSKERVKT